MRVLETDRLVVRRMAAEDAAFILELVNEPSWIRFIGDRGVRTLEDARGYIAKGPVAMYAREGFGLYLVERREDSVLLGMCGLLRRETLPDVDIGFAFLPRFWGQGYAREAAAAVMDHARATLGLGRIVAITSLDNDPSIRLLGKLGFQFEAVITLPGDTEELRLFASEARGPA